MTAKRCGELLKSVPGSSTHLVPLVVAPLPQANPGGIDLLDSDVDTPPAPGIVGPSDLHVVGHSDSEHEPLHFDNPHDGVNLLASGSDSDTGHPESGTPVAPLPDRPPTFTSVHVDGIVVKVRRSYNTKRTIAWRALDSTRVSNTWTRLLQVEGNRFGCRFRQC